MRRIGNPPAFDEAMAGTVEELFDARGVGRKDADASTGAEDFPERILGPIRGTGVTVAIFCEDTRGTDMANLALELGFASMCGKPLAVVKSKAAAAPFDLTRTDRRAVAERPVDLRALVAGGHLAGKPDAARGIQDATPDGIRAGCGDPAVAERAAPALGNLAERTVKAAGPWRAAVIARSGSRRHKPCAEKRLASRDGAPAAS